MPIRRSIHAYRSATPFEHALWMLGFSAAAVGVPTALRRLLGGLAAAGAGQAGYPVAAARMAVDATGLLIQWIGIAILAGVAGLCAWLAAAYLRGTRERGTGIPRWAIAEVYAIGAVAALAGMLWLR